MRWQLLFQDLEAEFRGLQRQDLEREIQEHTRAQVAGIALQELLRANVGTEVRVTARCGGATTGLLLEAYPQWILLEGQRSEVLVPATSIIGVQGLNRAVAPPAGATSLRLTLGHALRGLARNRFSVLVTTPGESYRGVFGHIGKDWAQLRLQRSGETRPLGPEVTLAHEMIGAVHNQRKPGPY